MKIIYLLSEFSGFEKILDEKKWVPTGVPTIHKIIEYTNRNHDINLVILSPVPVPTTTLASEPKAPAIQ